MKWTQQARPVEASAPTHRGDPRLPLQAGRRPHRTSAPRRGTTPASHRRPAATQDTPSAVGPCVEKPPAQYAVGDALCGVPHRYRSHTRCRGVPGTGRHTRGCAVRRRRASRLASSGPSGPRAVGNASRHRWLDRTRHGFSIARRYRGRVAGPHDGDLPGRPAAARPPQRCGTTP